MLLKIIAYYNLCETPHDKKLIDSERNHHIHNKYIYRIYKQPNIYHKDNCIKTIKTFLLCRNH